MAAYYTSVSRNDVTPLVRFVLDLITTCCCAAVDEISTDVARRSVAEDDVVMQVIGALTYENPSRAQWRKVFCIAAGVETFGCIVFLLFGSGEAQDWHDDANNA